MSDQEIQYPAEFTDKREVLWGKGFLSPGVADKVCEVIDEETYQPWPKIRRALRDATNVGALRPTHLRAYKPEA